MREKNWLLSGKNPNLLAARENMLSKNVIGGIGAYDFIELTEMLL
jgi:hypothetical protein